MTADQFAARLAERGWKTRHQGTGYRCQCPAHGGEDLNLAVDPGDNGGVVLTCWSHQCEAAAVAVAVGLTLADLMPPGPKPNGPPPPRQVVARYRYNDERGELVGEMWRYEPKSFRPFHLNAAGVWTKGDPPGKKLPLYRLPELLAADAREPVFICAGEKDTDRLASLGLIATTNPHGESVQWHRQPHWLEPLAGRRCVILEDFDAPSPETRRRPGEDHSREVFAALTEAGIEAKRLLLPGLAEGQDVSDWLDAGHTAAELLALALPEPHPFDVLVYDGPGLMAAEIPEPEWLVPGLIAKRVMTMLVGIGKLGKSVLAHQVCVAGATAGVWLDQQVPLTPCLYVNWEDPLGLTRARAVRQFAPQDLPPEYHAMEVPWGTPFPRFLEWLVDYLPRAGIGLVVIDPLGIAARWKDEKDNSETGPTLRDIQDVAQQTEAALLVVHHTRKMGGEEGLEVRGGSAIFAGVQGFLSFKRTGPGEYQLDTKDKMPGEHGGDKSFLLRRDRQTLTWHVSGELSSQEAEKQTSVEEMIVCIQIDPGITRRELATLTGLKESTLRNYLRPLLEDGILVEGERLRRAHDSEQHRPPKGLFFRS